MTHQTLLNRSSRLLTQTCQRLAVMASAVVPGMAMAELPTLEQPSQGGDGILGTAQGYVYDAGIFAGLLICTVAFIWIAVACLGSFNEARQRGAWGSFGATFFVGIGLLLVIIWLATQAGEILVA
nr:TIGR03745 family integrating conjugative element membrane protein [uncultured Halomonas sp.]